MSEFFSRLSDAQISTEMNRRVDVLAPKILAARDEIHRVGKIPSDLAKEAIGLGFCRLLTHRRYNGAEMRIPDCYDLIKKVARFDANVAWVFYMTSAAAMTTGYMNPDVAKEMCGPYDVFAHGPPPPAGKFTAIVSPQVNNGCWVMGYTPYCSGADIATYFGAHADVSGHGRRTMLLPRDHVSIDREPWSRKNGMRGTGSHHYYVDCQFVPRERIVERDKHNTLQVDGPLYEGFTSFRAACILATAASVGNALRAMDEAEMAIKGTNGTEGKTHQIATASMQNDGNVHRDMAEAELMLEAADAYMYKTISRRWDNALLRREESREEAIRIHAVGAFAIQQSRKVVYTLHHMLGADATSEGNLLNQVDHDADVMVGQAQGSPNRIKGFGEWRLTDKYSLPLP